MAVEVLRTCIANAYRLINRSGRIRMCCLAVYIKPFAASVGAHANACRALRAAIGKCRCTCQRMPHVQSRRRQSQVHMSMHIARSEPPSAIAGAHANACRTLIAAIDKRRCTRQCMPYAQGRYRQARMHMPTHAAPQNRYRQVQIHMPMHAARSEPPSTIAGAHINACARS